MNYGQSEHVEPGYNSFVGRNLRRVRESRGMSVEEVCSALFGQGYYVDREEYEACEQGRRNIRIGLIMELQRLYGCRWADFFSEAEQ